MCRYCGTEVILAVVVMVAVMVSMMGVFAIRYKKVPLNEAMVRYGR